MINKWCHCEKCGNDWCERDRLLTKEEIENRKQEFKRKEEEREARQKMLRGLPPSLLCGQDWIDQHASDFTQEDFENLTITVKSDKRQVTFKNKLNRKELKVAIASVK